MDYINIVLIAISLSLDAVAVAAANGAKHHKMSFGQAFKIAVFFGLFQFIMPIVGWLMSASLASTISSIDHWVAFVLLFSLGLKMLFESQKDVEEKSIDIHSLKILFLLSVATSVDALVIGITFALLRTNIITSSIVIGVITTILSLGAIYAGKKFGETWGKRSEVLGGLVLIFLGVKILISHLL
jgi:putative Mn2+ efflux pump MntP